MRIIAIFFLLTLPCVSVANVNLFEPEYSKAGFFTVKNSGREVFNFNVGWRFLKGEAIGAHSYDFDDVDWGKVNCPHGLEFNTTEASGSSNYQGPAWYRKHFTLKKSLSDKLIKVHFESIMGKAKVWLNGEFIGEHFGGYLPFSLELNKHLKSGDNVLAVYVDNSDDPTFAPGQPQTRLDFAYFGGIYRDVWLVATSDVYVSNANDANCVAGGGIFTHTNLVSDELAELFMQVHIKNDGATINELTAQVTLFDPGGKVVRESSKNLSILAGEACHIDEVLQIKNPKLWSPWSPDLYRLQVLLKDVTGKVMDGVAVKHGLRVIEFRGKDGLYLNNEPYPGKLMGANRHQDHGYVGNALPNNAQWKDVVILKSAACDIIRAAHYPADPAFMDACDALGVFYINATPGWHFWSDDPLFEKRVYNDIRHMVRRDRNRASVIMWEPILNETVYPEHFAKKAHDLVHEEYPFQGAFTVCDSRAKGMEHYDVVYAQDYNADFVNESRCIFTREFGDNVDDFNAQNSNSRVARGWGERPQLVQAKTYADAQQVKYTDWETIHQTPVQFVGGTLWCGFDHQRGYNCDPFYGGLADVFRQTKYSYYLFASQKNFADPMIFIAHEMTPFSEPDVTVFTNCDQVRLTVYGGDQVLQKTANIFDAHRVLTPHGEPIRKEFKGRKSIPHPYVTFEDVFRFKDLKTKHRGGKKYEATLVAEGIIDGKVVTTFTQSSGKHPTALKLTLENWDVPFTANGSDFVTVVASMVDEKGNVKRLNENFIKFEVAGEGEIIGDSSIGANPKRLSWGTAPVLIRSTTVPGQIEIKASLLYEGVNTPLSATLVIESKASPDRFIYSEMGNETNGGATSIVEKSSIDQLNEEIQKLERKIIFLELKEEERNQLEQDENR